MATDDKYCRGDSGIAPAYDVDCASGNQLSLTPEAMSDVVAARFREWTQGKNPREARIAIFNRIRDIPYAVIPELNHPQHYIKMLELNRGSCTPKHFLLCTMFQKLGLPVLYVAYRYRWDEFAALYPPQLRKLAEEMPLGNHLACKVDINGKLVLVDATLDPSLAIVGLPVNQDWDGISDTLLPVKPVGEEQVYYPGEGDLIQAQELTDTTRTFYNGLNAWMELLRVKSRGHDEGPT